MHHYDGLHRVPKPQTDLLNAHGRMLLPYAETLKLGIQHAALGRADAAERATEIVITRRANDDMLDARAR
jgi:hypothetical protein